MLRAQNGDKGYGSMSDSWFGEYVYQIVVDRRFLSAQLSDVWNDTTTAPIRLPAWDPMGALAQ